MCNNRADSKFRNIENAHTPPQLHVERGPGPKKIFIFISIHNSFFINDIIRTASFDGGGQSSSSSRWLSVINPNSMPLQYLALCVHTCECVSILIQCTHICRPTDRCPILTHRIATPESLSAASRPAPFMAKLITSLKAWRLSVGAEGRYRASVVIS